LGLVVNHTFRRYTNFKINKFLGLLLTFNLVNISLVFFRSETLENAINIFYGMSGMNGFNYLIFNEYSKLVLVIFIISFIIIFKLKNTSNITDKYI